jgi:hypothetical protein
VARYAGKFAASHHSFGVNAEWCPIETQRAAQLPILNPAVNNTT